MKIYEFDFIRTPSLNDEEARREKGIETFNRVMKVKQSEGWELTSNVETEFVDIPRGDGFRSFSCTVKREIKQHSV